MSVKNLCFFSTFLLFVFYHSRNISVIGGWMVKVSNNICIFCVWKLYDSWVITKKKCCHVTYTMGSCVLMESLLDSVMSKRFFSASNSKFLHQERHTRTFPSIWWNKTKFVRHHSPSNWIESKITNGNEWMVNILHPLFLLRLNMESSSIQQNEKLGSFTFYHFWCRELRF